MYYKKKFRKQPHSWNITIKNITKKMASKWKRPQKRPKSEEDLKKKDYLKIYNGSKNAHDLKNYKGHKNKDKKLRLPWRWRWPQKLRWLEK